MRALLWTIVAAAAAAVCLGPRQASAQYGYYRSGPGISEMSMGMGMSGYPAGSSMPLYSVAAAAPSAGSAGSVLR